METGVGPPSPPRCPGRGCHEPSGLRSRPPGRWAGGGTGRGPAVPRPGDVRTGCGCGAGPGRDPPWEPDPPGGPAPINAAPGCSAGQVLVSAHREPALPPCQSLGPPPPRPCGTLTHLSPPARKPTRIRFDRGQLHRDGQCSCGSNNAAAGGPWHPRCSKREPGHEKVMRQPIPGTYFREQ